MNLTMIWNPFAAWRPASSPPAPLALRLITHNIRYATTDPFKGERPWAERAPLVLSQLQHEVRSLVPQTTNSHILASSHSGVFICLQEVLHSQLVDVLVGLNHVPDDGAEPPKGPTWSHIGVGRDDGESKGEYSPILFPVQLFELLHNETVWLSPTPDKPSKGWDAGSIRLLTAGVFRHRTTGRKVVVANTHLDNDGSKSRFESVSIILETLRRLRVEWAGDGDGDGDREQPPPGLVLAGDFNSFPTQEAYMAMKASGYLTDLHDEVAEADRYGDVITFTGFRPDKDNKDEQGRIDFLWFGPNAVASNEVPPSGTQGFWRFEGYAVLPNVFDSKVYLSDHRAVVGDVTLL